MTRERAAELLSEVMVLDDPEMAEAHRVAISALRRETVTKCHDLFDEDGGEILKSETVTNRSRLNEPLTMDELRKMDGEPVWVQSPGVPEYGRWAIVEGVGENCLFLRDDFTCHDYGKTWLAYRQKPEEDDHDERKENENV